jgi:hypothetical protein
MTRAGLVFRALIVPDSLPTLVRFSRIGLIVAILAVSAVAGILEVRAQPRELGRELYLSYRLEQLEALLLNAPPNQYDRARAQAEAEAERAFSPIRRAAQALAHPLRRMVAAVEVWLLLRLLVQFAGGEERIETGRNHRLSRRLVLLAVLHVAVGGLVESGILASTVSGVYDAVAGYEEFRRAASVSVSFAWALGLSLDSPSVEYLVYSLTNPFYWCAGYTLVVGGSEVFRLKHRSMLVVSLVLLSLFALQHGAIVSIQGFFGA